MYSDGIFVASGTTTTTNINSDNYSTGFRIGEQSATSYEFAGGMSNVARWKYSTSSALTTKWTAAAIKLLFLEGPDANWRTNHSSDMEVYYAMGNHLGGVSGTTADIAATVYDRKGSGTAYNGTTAGSMVAPNSETKYLIHSNTDIDGDTSIVDSSPSEHVIDRVVADPQYANTNTNRTVLGYDGVLFKTNGLDYLKVWTQPLELRDDWTVAFWLKFKESSSGTTAADKWFFSAGAGSGVDGGLA